MAKETVKKITIEVSVATHELLCGLERQVAGILNIPVSRVSHEKMILVAVAVKGLEDALTDMALGK